MSMSVSPVSMPQQRPQLSFRGDSQDQALDALEKGAKLVGEHKAEVATAALIIFTPVTLVPGLIGYGLWKLGGDKIVKKALGKG